MSSIVLCDTNAVIQLAIICPKIFLHRSEKFSLIVHFSVRQEINQLRNDPDKNSRLGQVFELIFELMPFDHRYQAPTQKRVDRLDKTIRTIEKTLPRESRSAPSSRKDRQFLILARENELSLLTNERTLLNLSTALLGEERTWAIAKALRRALELETLDLGEVREGVAALARYGEFLRRECVEDLSQILGVD